MSIRLRVIAGRMVALCAARSVPMAGDVYLDDAAHEALAEKFRADLCSVGDVDPEYTRRVEIGESGNPAREEWDRTYGPMRATSGYVHVDDGRPEPETTITTASDGLEFGELAIVDGHGTVVARNGAYDPLGDFKRRLASNEGAKVTQPAIAPPDSLENRGSGTVIMGVERGELPPIEWGY